MGVIAHWVVMVVLGVMVFLCVLAVFGVVMVVREDNAGFQFFIRPGNLYGCRTRAATHTHPVVGLKAGFCVMAYIYTLGVKFVYRIMAALGHKFLWDFKAFDGVVAVLVLVLGVIAALYTTVHWDVMCVKPVFAYMTAFGFMTVLGIKAVFGAKAALVVMADLATFGIIAVLVIMGFTHH